MVEDLVVVDQADKLDQVILHPLVHLKVIMEVVVVPIQEWEEMVEVELQQ